MVPRECTLNILPIYEEHHQKDTKSHIIMSNSLFCFLFLIFWSEDQARTFSSCFLLN